MEAERTDARTDPGKEAVKGGGERKHLRNGCGSESGKSERKQTAKLSTGIWKEGMRNQAGENGGSRRSESEGGSTEEATAGRSQEEGKGSAEAE